MAERDVGVGGEGGLGEGDLLQQRSVGERSELAQENLPFAGLMDWMGIGLTPRQAYQERRPRTRVPAAMSAGAAYSSGRWLTPPRQGMKIMAMGAMHAMKEESW